MYPFNQDINLSTSPLRLSPFNKGWLKALDELEKGTAKFRVVRQGYLTRELRDLSKIYSWDKHPTIFVQNLSHLG